MADRPKANQKTYTNYGTLSAQMPKADYGYKSPKKTIEQSVKQAQQVPKKMTY